MKKIVYLFVSALVMSTAFCASAQTSETAASQGMTKEQIKEAKKYIQDKKDSIDFVRVLQAIQDREFLLTVTSITYSGGGADYGLSENTNYIVVQNDGGIFQTSHNWGEMGMNGIGGITIPGRVGDITTKIDKKGNANVDFHIRGSYGNVDIYISIPRNGTAAASANVSATMHGGSITMYGTIMPYHNPDLRIEK